VTVIGSDGEEIGNVAEVVADRQQGIFSGLTISSGLFSNDRFLPADLVEEITAEAVRVSLTASEADNKLEPYS
jgi:uncharacterized protein YrrD